MRQKKELAFARRMLAVMLTILMCITAVQKRYILFICRQQILCIYQIWTGVWIKAVISPIQEIDAAVVLL